MFLNIKVEKRLQEALFCGNKKSFRRNVDNGWGIRIRYDAVPLDIIALKFLNISIHGNIENLDDSEIGKYMKKPTSVYLIDINEQSKEFFDKINFFDPSLKDNSTILYIVYIVIS